MSPLAVAGAYAAAFSGLLLIAAYPTTIVLFVLWEYRTIRAANSKGVTSDHVPIDAITCWVIPILNLWAPYVLMRRLCAVLAPATIRTAGVWWVSYLLTLVSLKLPNAGAVEAVWQFVGCVSIQVAAGALARIIRAVQDGLDAAPVLAGADGERALGPVANE